MVKDPREAGLGCSRKRVAWLMRLHGLAGEQRRNIRPMTDSSYAHPVIPNLLRPPPPSSRCAEEVSLRSSLGW